MAKKYTHVAAHCPVCGVKIFDICDKCRRAGLALPNQMQFLVDLSNGNQAYLGVCEKEMPRMTVKMAEAIWQGVLDATAPNGPEVHVVKVHADSAVYGSQNNGAMQYTPGAFSVARLLRRILRILTP